MIRLLGVLILLLQPILASAEDLKALESPTAIVLMRHALAPGTGDPSGFRMDDCTTQRNLDDRGRDQARRIGERLRTQGIGFDAIWSSQWCRCRDTAALLGLGQVAEVPALNSFFADRRQRDPQTKAALDKIAAVSGRRLLLVTHQVNITALTGIYPQSGEIVVTEWRDGALEVTGRILIDP
ncbi:histidine phosphatase family protein [Marimonas arenosa]|uniref:Histidine phosphatase family protein n=1 Tax=Marimonas arenosa TaxID=1795305 RepID=A0AAE3W9M4_9RHOB|nr:histidine phosphatase family protein [Marimonas arenosa]MDQ2088425.1 histidine phosphatase family protein [Marimonas arenosa]